MSISVLAQGNGLSGMRALLALLIAQAQILVDGPDVSGSKLLKLVRTIRRLIKVIIDVEVTIYQSRMLTKMLSDPAWRARVIAGFGGYAGLYQWQNRHKLAVLKAQESHDETVAAPRETSQSPRPPKHAAKIQSRTLSDPIFVLPPLPRGFYGRVKPADIWRPYEPTIFSPLHAPIIVTLAELMAKRAAPPAARPVEIQSETEDGYKDKPPKPYPP